MFRTSSLDLHRRLRLAACGALLFGLAFSAPKAAQACGCFAPPDVSAPLVQAGEKIVFVVANGTVTMHVQLKYSGRSGDFGWLLPLPATPINSQGMPGIDVGVDELFSQLEARTQPYYILQRNPCQKSSGFIGCGAASSAGLADSAMEPPAAMSPLVKQDTIGPYNYAILKADDKSQMLAWLSSNGYVIPTGTDGAVAPYIHPGAFFLALKLRAGATAGDMQPVVLSYKSDLPMVPINLTAVGAAPHMGVLIWVLGSARAIPRNYSHTVINPAQLDWLNSVKNYNDVITAAVGEAEGKHSFVTEYAGTSQIMQQILDGPGRFDVLQSVMTQRDPVAFIQAILPVVEPDYNVSGYFIPTPSHVSRGFALNGQLYSVLGGYVPIPQQLIAEGVTPDDYYQRIDFYLRTDRSQRPSAYADIEAQLTAFNPSALANDLNARIVSPTLAAGSLFTGGTFPQLTRLYTTLSPEDMNADPVFSFNSELGDVSNVHNATLDLSCNNDGGRLTFQDNGLQVEYSQDEIDQSAYKPDTAPMSQRIERLRDTGMPEVVVDNYAVIRDSLGQSGQGCATADPSRRPTAAPFMALWAAAFAALLFRRRLTSRTS